MTNLRLHALKQYIGEFLSRHKKVVLCCVIVFVVSIVLGVVCAISETDGDFEKVARVDAQVSGAKVFFVFSRAMIGGYFVIVVSGAKTSLAFLGVVPHFALGFVLGRYATALLARYEGFGVINLIFVYLPLFLCTFVLATIALCNTISTPSPCDRGKAFTLVVKIAGVNLALALLFVVIIGSIFGVIVVKMF